MAAITWREIVGSPDTGAFRALDGAASTVNAGFEALNRVLAGRQAANQYQVDKGQDAQSLAFREALAGATSEDQVKKIQEQRDVMLAGLDPARRALLVGAEEARISSVRQNILAGQEFKDKQTIWDSRDSVNNAFAGALASKDPAKITTFMDSIPANHPMRGELGGKLLGILQGNARTDSELLTGTATREKMAAESAATTKNAETSAGQLAVAQQNATTNAGQLTVHKQQVDQQAVRDIEGQRAALAERMSAVSKGQFGSDEGQKSYDTAIKLAAGDRAPTVLRFAGEALSSDPKYRNMPTDVVTEIVKKHAADFGTQGWLPDFNVASRIKADLEKAYGTKAVLAQMDRTEMARQQVGSQLQALNGVSDITLRRAYPEFGAGLDAAIARREAAAVGAPAAAARTTPAAPTGGAMPTDTSNLPPPTQRFNNPPDSPAGLVERRVFEEQQRVAQSDASKQVVRQTQVDAAKQVVAEILKAGDSRKAAELQTSTEFRLLDRESKAKIFDLVNNGPAKKAR